MTGELTCVPALAGRRRRGGALGTRRIGPIGVVLAVVVLLACSHLSAAEGSGPHLGDALQRQGPRKTDSTMVRYRVFSLRHISAKKGKEYLAEAKIGTVSQLPSTNMLLVTALPRELITASAILKLVDAEQRYVMKTISPALAAQDYPSNEQIAAELGDILIGTFSNPPTGIGQTKAIIDIHNDAIVAIAPESQFQRIASTFKQAQALQGSLPKNGESEIGPLETVTADTLRPAYPDKSIEPNLTALGGPTKPASPNETHLREIAGQFIAREKAESRLETLRKAAAAAELIAPPDANEAEARALFSRLLGSLARVEEKAAGRQAEPETAPLEAPPEPTAPNEPISIALIPAANEPDTTVTMPAAAEPNVVVPPPMEVNLPSEPPAISEQPVDRLQGVALGEILRRLQTLEADVKAGPVPGPGPEVRPLVPKIEHPNEVGIEAVPPEIEQPNDVNEAAEPVEEPGLYEPEPLPNGEDVLKIQLPETLPMIDFLSFMGEHLQLDYLYDPAEVKGNVTLRLHGKLRGEIKVRMLYPLLESVMQFHGFVMSRKEGSSIVTIRKTDKMDTLIPTIVRGEGDKVEAGDVIITRVFELEHADPVSAQNLLTNVKLGAGVTPVAEAGTLVVTNYASHMARIEELLEMIDKPGEPKQFRFRQLQYTMATVLASKVEKLVQELGEVSVTVARTPEKPQPPRRDARGRITRPRRPTRPTTPAPGQPQPGARTVYLDFDERTNRILMIGHAEQLDVVEELIDALDVAQQDLRALRVYEIQYIDAEEVRKKLAELGIIGGVETAPRRPSRREQPTRRAAAQKAEAPKAPAPPTATTAAAVEQPLVEEPQVIIIESINSLLVNATAEQHAQIAMIIGYVDNEAEMTTIPYVVYPLENQNPEDLAAVLNQLIQETTTKQEKDAKIITHTQRVEEDIIIIPDTTTYSLIVYASKKNQQWVSALIRQLDEYRPQVLLDVVLAEVIKNDEFQLDLDIATSFPDPLDPDFAGRLLLLSSTKGVLDGFYTDEQVDVVLKALQTKGYGRILARPKLLVNDNQEGTIKDERTTTIVSAKTQVVPGTAATASVAAPSVEFQSYTEGIVLTIMPHISKGDQLQLTISLTRTNFDEQDDYVITVPGSSESGGGEIRGPTPPDLLATDVATVVTVPDQHTIILGGLERVNQGKSGTKVPILGDIPFIGGLFRSTLNNDTQSRLYVFVKPHILRPGEPLDGDSALELVTAKNEAKFERYEREMQEYEDWPGIKPKPMDPLSILDD